MNVKPSESMGEAWATLEGHVVNGVFPLRRYLGSSDHSGVFLSEFTSGAPSQVALKLVPVTGKLAESQLSLWFAASVLDCPQLLRLLDAGRCQVGGLHYVYAAMEYADQNLAQLLEHRALTEDEAREMLAPTLEALAFLHGRGLVQGRVKPSNILVVGDGLKLASDTIRPAGEVGDGVNAMSGYDAPETRDGSCSGAGDVWALGVTLCEALTRRPPSGLRDSGGRVVLPPELSAAFRELIGRCLSREAGDRPNVAEIEAWMRGEATALARVPAPAADLQPLETIALLEPATPEPISYEHAAPVLAPVLVPVPVPVTVPGSAVPAMPPVSPIAARPAEPVRRVSDTVASPGFSADQPSKRGALRLIVGAVIVIALGWVGMRMLRTDHVPTSTPPATEGVRDAGVQTPAASAIFATPPTASKTAPVAHSAPPPSQAAPDAAVSLSEVHKEIPDVARRARQTIRGHVRVSVRVIVNKDGAVFAALTDQRGPSRYFERLAIEAGKKWTFSPVETDAQRIAILRFDFTREGTTARAVPVR